VTDYEPAVDFKSQLRTGRAPVWPKEVADVYDARSTRGGGLYGEDELATVAFLEELARGGPALELAIGTGRIGLPLAARGIQVDGIDNSPAMVDKLRTKPGGDQMSITIGDLADVEVTGVYRLIFLVANTLGNLLTQDNQVRCFENVAAHLTDDGFFVVEAYSPAWLYQLQNDQYVQAEAIDVGYVALDTARHDPVKQTEEECHVILTRDRVRLYPIVTRYVWPSEMDLMARIAGLRLKERWGGWNRELVTANPRSNCISVYGR
jgi:SAM-dependent methyltransferase